MPAEAISIHSSLLPSHGKLRMSVREG
jgi:hypothetical protein